MSEQGAKLPTLLLLAPSGSGAWALMGRAKPSLARLCALARAAQGPVFWATSDPSRPLSRMLVRALAQSQPGASMPLAQIPCGFEALGDEPQDQGRWVIWARLPALPEQPWSEARLRALAGRGCVGQGPEPVSRELQATPGSLSWQAAARALRAQWEARESARELSAWVGEVDAGSEGERGRL